MENAETSEEIEQLRIAVQQADLNPVQREMIEAFLKTGERIDSYLVATRINPDTNKPYTRNTFSLQWLRACEKIRHMMPQFAEEAA
jgi:hypothetical protein